MLVKDAFDLETRVFEVEEQGSLEAGDVEIAEHLSEVVLDEASDDLWIDNHQVLNDEVGDQGPDVLAVVADDEFPLNIATQALFSELDHESAFVELFVEAGFEGVEHLHGSTDDDFCELGVSVHGEEEF